MPAERPFNKYSRPGMLKPLDERRPNVTLPSWQTISGKLDLMTHNLPERNDAKKLIRIHRILLKEIYDGWYDVAAGRGRKKLDELTNIYTTDKESPLYNPGLIDQLSPFIISIRDSFPLQIVKRR